MQPESGSFSPALENVLGRIKEAGKADYFFSASVNSLKYLRGEITSIANERDWQDVRFGSMEKKAIPALKQAREAVDWKRLAVACGPGNEGAVNLAQLFREMQQSGLVTGKEPIESVAIKAASLLAFPMDHLGHKRLRKWFEEIVKDELVRFPAAGLPALAERAVDILAWEKARYGFAADLGEKYEEDVDSGRIKPGEEINLQPDELQIEIAPDRQQPGSVIDVLQIGESVLIKPGGRLELSSSGEQNDGLLAARINLGAETARVFVQDRGTKTMPYVIEIIDIRNGYGKIKQRLGQENPFDSYEQELRMITVSINNRNYGIDQTDAGFRVFRSGQTAAAEAPEVFADLCRVATVAVNAALGLPVPEAEEEVDLSQYAVESVFWRDVPDDQLPLHLLAARRENQQMKEDTVEEKPAKPITSSAPEPEW